MVQLLMMRRSEDVADDTEEADVNEDDAEVDVKAGDGAVADDAEDAATEAKKTTNSGYRTCMGRKSWVTTSSDYSPLEVPIADDDACKKCCTYQDDHAGIVAGTHECRCGPQTGDGNTPNDFGFLVEAKTASV